MASIIDQFVPGQRVVITQQIPQRERVWTTKVVGVVIKAEQKKTGSWFAHAKDDKLWLDRLTLKKDDGEIVVCNLDEFTHVEMLTPPAPAAAATVPGAAGHAGHSAHAGPPDAPKPAEG